MSTILSHERAVWLEVLWYSFMAKVSDPFSLSCLSSYFKVIVLSSLLLDFAPSQFSIDKPQIGNTVFLKSSLHSIECRVVPTDVSQVRVACETG